MIIVSLLDYSWLLNFYWVLYIGNLMMLGVLYLGGSTAKTRWCDPLDSDRKLSVSADRAVKNLSDHVFAMFLMKHEEDLNTAKTILPRSGF